MAGFSREKNGITNAIERTQSSAENKGVRFIRRENITALQRAEG
jgi:hypothetical protein